MFFVHILHFILRFILQAVCHMSIANRISVLDNNCNSCSKQYYLSGINVQMVTALVKLIRTFPLGINAVFNWFNKRLKIIGVFSNVN